MDFSHNKSMERLSQLKEPKIKSLGYIKSGLQLHRGNSNNPNIHSELFRAILRNKISHFTLIN